MKNKVRRKPTAKEMASAIIEINGKVNEVTIVCRELDRVLGMYIEMKGDLKKFNAYVEQVVKKKEEEQNDAKTNERPDKPNLQGDTDGEGSRTERVREKAK
jgi:hypothetical protein